MSKNRKTKANKKNILHKYSEQDIDNFKIEISILKDAYFQLKETKSELQESEDSYKILFENSHDIIQNVKPDGNFTFVNKAWIEILGYSLNEAKKMNIWEIIHPEHLQHCKKIFSGLMNGKDIGLIQTKFITKKGKTINVEGNISIRIKNGKIFSTHGFFRDITDRKKSEKDLAKAHNELEYKVKKRTAELEKEKASAEEKARKLDEMKTATLNILEDMEEAKEQLIEKENKFRALFEGAGDTIFIVKMDQKNAPYIIDINSRALEMFGYTHKQMLKSSPLSFAPIMQPDGKSSKEKTIENIKFVLRGETKVFEWDFLRSDGTQFSTEVTLNRVKIGGEFFVQSIVRDITARKEIDRAKNEFVSLASHQLQTPLTAIKWLLQVLLLKEKMTKQQHSLIEEALESNERMIRLVDDFLNVSRLDMGTIVANSQKTDFIKFTENLVIEARILAKERRQTIKFIKPKNKLTVYLDKNLISQVILNLLSNAIRYSDPKKKIVITIKKLAKTVEISIKDQGIGISKKDQKKLFAKFFRTDRASEYSTTGSGLGLYMIKKIIKVCKGHIKINSRPGKGSTFTVTLPIKGPVSKKEDARDLIERPIGKL